MLTVALLANYLPEVLVRFGFGTLPAWFVFARNLQAAALWWLLGRMIEALSDARRDLAPYRLPGLAVCSYGIFEAAQVPACRLAFPMDRAPPVHPEGVCGAAGLPTYDVAPVLMALCAVLVARALPTFTEARPRQV
jgi:hypothetical protein